MENHEIVNSPAQDSQVVVVGGGAAGCATAISCAQRGLPVTLIEGATFPRQRPGETLHPGVKAILQLLRVEDKVAATTQIRHEGHYVYWGSTQCFIPFGGDKHDSWKGYQILRETLDNILLEEARRIGVRIIQPCLAHRPILDGHHVIGVKTDKADYPARWVVNCAGSNPWFNRHLGIVNQCFSPRLFAYYGYCHGTSTEHPPQPVLAANSDGWTWTAKISDDMYQWTRLPFTGFKLNPKLPANLRNLTQLGKPRSAEVTWRFVSESAGAGYFLAGDAAAALDPSASHGVLRALMSGIMAAHTIQQLFNGTIDEEQGIDYYRNWLRTWFHNDLTKLKDLYRRLDPIPPWIQDKNP